MKRKKVYISGMHSGQNPCSGLGIARCLRKAFPDLTLVGVDHGPGCSGLHDATVDEVLLLPQWKQIDDDRHVQDVRKILDDGNLWIVAMDMEVHWMARNIGSHENLLAPGKMAIQASAKPAVEMIRNMDFRVADYIPASLPDSEIHSFLRHSSWQCWLKSPFHDAKRVSSWRGFEAARDSLKTNWKTSKLFLQRHVVGNEETVAFTAYNGELLSAVHLQKRQLTPEGKTWAGKVTPVTPDFFEQFAEALRPTGWNGGGELEYIRDLDGQKWIIECNPRFPAWIFGGAVAGHNLPAKLVSHVWDMPFMTPVSHFPMFIRVVQEIPAKEDVGLPPPPDPTLMAWMTDSKKGKGGPMLVGSYYPTVSDDENEEDEDEKESPTLHQDDEPVSEAYLDEVASLVQNFEGETPARLHLESWTQQRFNRIAGEVSAARSRHPQIQLGYSVKTSPTDDHLRKAKKLGFYAECISQAEVHRALNFGFKPHEVILNGPGKFWPLTGQPVTGLHMLFCDSIEEFDRVIQVRNMAKVLGFRMRVPKVHSRFGNPLDDFGNFRKMIGCVRRIEGRAELGFHFHMPSWAIGVERWTQALQSLLVWCQTFEQLSEVPVRHLDLGGGFFPADLERLDFGSVQNLVHEALPNVERLYFEPGRAMTQDGEVLVSRVLDVRHTPAGDLLEIVVDACIAELPLAAAFTHKIFHLPRGSNGEAMGPCTLLRKGSTRVLGRICMEDDILSSGLDLPEDVAIGDLVIFGDAGGYERSMSYVFGRG